MKIETGVDRLVKLMASNKRLKVDDAAQILSAPKAVILDWADVLERNQFLIIKYSLTSPTLVLKEYTKEEIQKRAMEYKLKKEGLKRKVDYALNSLNRHGSGIESFKTTFKVLKKDIHVEIKDLKQELEELEELESQKRKINLLMHKSKKSRRIINSAKKLEVDSLKARDKVLSKAKRGAITKQDKNRIIDKFKLFFEKKSDVDKLILQIEKEYQDIHKEYLDLLAETDHIDMENPKTYNIIKKMEKHLIKLKNKKENLSHDLIRLNKMMVGK